MVTRTTPASKEQRRGTQTERPTANRRRDRFQSLRFSREPGEPIGHGQRHPEERQYNHEHHNVRHLEFLLFSRAPALRCGASELARSSRQIVDIRAFALKTILVKRVGRGDVRSIKVVVDRIRKVSRTAFGEPFRESSAGEQRRTVGRSNKRWSEQTRG